MNNTPDAGKKICNYKFLIVDDEARSVKLFSDILTQWGNICKFASDGIEGFEAAIQSHFDLVLMDIVMPNMNGIECIQAIRLIDPHVPIIIMTGYASPEEIKEGLAQGANAYIKKPFTIDELSNLIRKLVRY